MLPDTRQFLASVSGIALNAFSLPFSCINSSLKDCSKVTVTLALSETFSSRSCIRNSSISATVQRCRLLMAPA
ncbi:hypothetical protein CC78DRAFT_385122 [Lojkania enalia]|uniref:Uncharacterized protein n=1 Tax=Lojkania enalia TaxID=147567 RepID=A0A9P4K638_9PLEO|nr:hypothetical protein CC78DRAFT_385122 [Didymosphaeria enalia]